VAEIGKKIDFSILLKVSFLTIFVECLTCVPRPEKRENSPKMFENLSILTNFDYILKKVEKSG
jgi:hypothetical protein